MNPRLNLVVLRAAGPEMLAGFYSELGLVFELHRHGAGPEHFASEDGGVVFEIYPASQKSPPTAGLRLGFEVGDVREMTNRLVEAGATVISGPTDSPWGMRAVVQDPEGHKLELTQGDGGSADDREDAGG